MTVSAALIDVDGTLYAAGAAIPGAADAVRALRDRGLALRFLTNTDSVTGETVAARLRALDIPVPADDVSTPLHALRRLLNRQDDPSCYLIVSEELRDTLDRYERDDDVRAVVVGDCRDNFSYELLDRGLRHLLDGADLLALQREPFFLRADGPHLDTGAVVAALEYASGQTARLLGKPSPEFFLAPVSELGVPPDEVVIVGDDVTTDIAGANAIGAASVLLRTGKYVAGQTREHDADHVVDSIADVPDLLAELTT